MLLITGLKSIKVLILDNHIVYYQLQSKLYRIYCFCIRYLTLQYYPGTWLPVCMLLDFIHYFRNYMIPFTTVAWHFEKGKAEIISGAVISDLSNPGLVWENLTIPRKSWHLYHLPENSFALPSRFIVVIYYVPIRSPWVTRYSHHHLAALALSLSDKKIFYSGYSPTNS